MRKIRYSSLLAFLLLFARGTVVFYLRLVSRGPCLYLRVSGVLSCTPERRNSAGPEASWAARRRVAKGSGRTFIVCHQFIVGTAQCVPGDRETQRGWPGPARPSSAAAESHRLDLLLTLSLSVLQCTVNELATWLAT